jgi:hypothetical protein
MLIRRRGMQNTPFCMQDTPRQDRAIDLSSERNDSITMSGFCNRYATLALSFEGLELAYWRGYAFP